MNTERIAAQDAKGLGNGGGPGRRHSEGLTIEVPSRNRSSNEDSTLSTVTMVLEDSTSRRLSSSSISLSDKNYSKRHSSDLSAEAEQKKLKPARFRESKRKISMMLPVSRLKFSSLGLVGRDEETVLLKDCLERVAPGSRELVLVSGVAGCGKTVLATSIEKSVKNIGGLYVRGKFDLYQRDEPYSGIAAAFREICGAILSLRGQDSFDEIRTELIDKLGPENLSVLTNIVGELAEIVGDDLIIDTMMEQSSEETKARSNYAFRILVRIVASRFAPLVIFLDDIQWADAATLDLLRVLISDRDNPSLMVVGAYRSNEVDEAHPLTHRIREMKRGEERDGFSVTEIEIGDLDSSHVNEMIMRLLSVDDASITVGLANVCYKRTRGNALSLVVFLEMLQEEGLLEYNIARFGWQWDDERILSASAATSNVVDLMKKKIERLPTSMSQRLSIAACLGYSFEPAILETVWTNIFGDSQDCSHDRESTETDDDVDSFLRLVEQDGFLEKEESANSPTYRWVHDKVQEAAMSIVPADELPKLKAQIGKILMDSAVDADRTSYIFTVVTLLNEGGLPQEESSRLQMAELALLASRKAKGQSAFESAGKFAGIGIASLPTNTWSDHYDLTLDLHSTAAEVAGYLGNADTLEKYFDEVLKQQDRPLSDKLRVFRAMISYMMGSFGRPDDAVKLLLQILSQLGLKFPSGKGMRLLSTISGLQKAKRKLSSFEPSGVRGMPTMDDPVHLEMMRFLDQLKTAAIMAKSDMLPLSILASFQLTMKYGLSEYAANAFATTAMLLGAALGDFALAAKTGNIARATMAVVDSRNMEAQTEFWLNGFVYCWTDFSARMTSRFLNSYETALSVGDNEYACWCSAFYLDYVFLTGKPLGTVEADCMIYMKQMAEFQREITHADMSIFCEMVRNLIGRYEGDPTVITGTQRFLSHSDHFVHVWFYSCQSILYMYFGEDEKGAKLAIERGEAYAKGVPGQGWNMIDAYARGMSLYSFARRSKKRKFRRHARIVHRTIKSWVRKGNPNAQHYDLLMDAESAALGGKLKEAHRCYLAAIVSATRQGYIHDSALACERYGEFLIEKENDQEEASHQLSTALQRYEEWGAGRKASLLREKYHSLWRDEKPMEVILDPGDGNGSKL